MPSLASSLSVLLASASCALAHFTLDYPTTRGFTEDIEDQFCGGFKDPSSNRTSFPLNGTSSIAIDAVRNFDIR